MPCICRTPHIYSYVAKRVNAPGAVAPVLTVCEAPRSNLRERPGERAPRYALA